MRGDETGASLSESAEQLVKLARTELGDMSARRRAEGFLKLSARRSPPKRYQQLVLGCAAVVTALALVLAGRRWLGPQQAEALSFAVQAGTAEPTLRFSDGTTLTCLGGAQARVKSVGEHGARVALMGKVDVAVVHSSQSQWLFDAGPFLIQVTGTAFTAEWRDAEGRLEVALRAGSLRVTGPLSNEPIALKAGQRLLISTREQEVLIRDLNSSAAPAALPQPSAEPSSEAPEEPSAPAVASVAPGAPARAASNWSSELAAGHFAAIVQEAEQRGLDAALAEVSSADLAALSDAARYSRREDVARRALSAQRRRFPRSARANDAAFLLGRLEEAAQRPEQALGWYEQCLNESPSGTYVSEALGRKLTVVQRLQGADRARPIAEEYLRRFANGTYAAAARALLRAP